MHLNLATAQTLLQFAPDALVLVDARSQVAYANDGVSTVFGYQPEELIGAPLAQLVPERFRESHGLHVQMFARDPGQRPMGQRGIALFARRRDGSEFPASVSLGPIRIDGSFYVMAAVRDVSDAQRMTDELHLARDEAERANRAKSFFLATASHDLRQPLQALQLLNGALRRRFNDSAADLFAQHQVAVHTMTEMLNAVLDIGRLESGTVEPQLEEVAVAQLCNELSVQFRPLATAKGLTLAIEPSGHSLRTDRVLMLRMIQNLLANAIKYTASGGVSMSCTQSVEDLCIQVSDTGAGIPVDRLSKIFDTYYQPDHTQRGQGLGLGLAIVKRIAGLLGYGIEVESQPGAGTRFRISIPAEHLAARGASVAPALAARQSELAQRRRILVIEDDRSVRDATLRFLRLEGLDVLGAATAREAEELLRREPNAVHLLISDFNLGDNRDGREVVESLIALSGRRLPVIFLSGDTSLTLRRLQDLPGTRVLNKPVDIGKLTRAIAALLQS